MILNEFFDFNKKHSPQQWLAEGSDKYGFHTSVSKGKFLPSKYGQDENNLYLHDLMNVSGDGSGPQLVTIDDKRIATEIAAMYGGYVERTDMGTYRVYQPRGARLTTKKPEQQGVAEGKMAELEMDLEDPEITDRQFEKMYGMTRKEAREQFSQTDMWAFPEIRDPNRPLHERGVAEAFGPLPKDNKQIRLGKYSVDIERVGLNKNYISFAWHDSQGKEHYEEVAVGDLGSYDDLIERIKDEIRFQERQYTDQGVAEGYQLDEGAVETITALAKKIPGIGKYYQMAQQYKPQLIEILKTSKSSKEVKQKMEQLAAGQSATVAESGMTKQLGGLAVGSGSILSTMWMNAMGMIDGVLAHAAAGEVGGAVASGSILGLIPVTLMLFAAMLMFKGSKQSSDEKAQAFQAQRGQQGVAEDSTDTVYPNAEVIKSKNGRPVGEIYQDGNSWGAFHYRADRGYDMIDSREDAIQALKDLHQETGRGGPDYTIKGVTEVSRDTLKSYQQKVSADSMKHSADPTKRSQQKANRSVAGFAKAQNRLEQGVAEGKGYTIDDEDREIFTPDEIDRIKKAHFPDTLRDNLIAAKKAAKKKAEFDKIRGNSDGGDSNLGSPTGTWNYESVKKQGVAEATRPTLSQMYKVGWNDGVEDEFNEEYRNDPEYNRGFEDGLDHAIGPKGYGRSNPKRYKLEQGVAEVQDQSDIEVYYHVGADADSVAKSAHKQANQFNKLDGTTDFGVYVPTKYIDPKLKNLHIVTNSNNMLDHYKRLSEQGVAEGSTSHAELAKLAHDAYVAASRKGNGPMAAYYLKQYLKHKADAAKDIKQYLKHKADAAKDKKGVAEGLAEVSDTTKQSYKAKAQAQVKELEPHAKKGEYRDIAQRAIDRRQRGLNRLAGRANAESRDPQRAIAHTDFDSPEWHEKVRGIGQRAKQGPLKTVWDEKRKVFRNVPVDRPPANNNPNMNEARLHRRAVLRQILES